MSRESNRPIRQELMLGLIYPAVLGTILYQLFFSLCIIGVIDILALLWNDNLIISIVTMIILSLITIWFGFLISRMRKFS